MLLMSDVQPTLLALRRAVYTHYLLTHNARSSSPPIHTRMDSQTTQGPRREWGLTLRSPSSNIRGASAGGEVPDRFISVFSLSRIHFASDQNTYLKYHEISNIEEVMTIESFWQIQNPQMPT